MNKIYQCECGKICTSANSFNGHKSKCKVHLGEDRYNEIMAKSIKFLEKATNSLKTQTEKKRLDTLSNWILEEHWCECCGKIMTEYYGSGRFCSQSCSNTHHLSDSSKEKISKSLIKRNAFNRKNVARKPKISLVRYQGEQLAKELDVINSPYSDYTHAYVRKQVDKRKSIKLCKYDDNRLISTKIVLYYRYLMEYKLGRFLAADEVVHHKDGNPENNSLDNLEVMKRSEHSKYHSSVGDYF